MSNASENTKNYYLLYAEPFLDNPSICDIANRNFLNKEFAISTFGYDSYSNYANNLNCSIVLEGLAVNSQAVLELFDLRMESGADFLQINDLNVKISSLDGNDRYYAYPLEQKSAALEISSDQLGSRVGVNAKMHILAPPQTTFIDLCMTSLAHVLMPQNTAFWQYQITSCKGRVSLVILDPFAGLYEVYDGEFDKGPRLSTNQGSVIVSSGRMLSLRLSLMQPQANPVYEFVASDSFTDQEGNICGGVIHYMFSDSTYNTFNLSSVEGCVLYVDKITAHIQTTAAVPVFPGCTLDKDKLIPSSKDVPLNLYVGWMAAPFTILIPANFSDEEQLLLNFEQEIWLSDSDSALVASSDYLQVDDQNMFKGGIVASIFYKGTQQQVLFFELLQALGDGQLVFGNESRKYSGHDGIFSRLIENGTQIVYNSTLTGKGRLIARYADMRVKWLQWILLACFFGHSISASLRRGRLEPMKNLPPADAVDVILTHVQPGGSSTNSMLSDSGAGRGSILPDQRLFGAFSPVGLNYETSGDLVQVSTYRACDNRRKGPDYTLRGHIAVLFFDDVQPFLAGCVAVDNQARFAENSGALALVVGPASSILNNAKALSMRAARIPVVVLDETETQRLQKELAETQKKGLVARLSLQFVEAKPSYTLRVQVFRVTPLNLCLLGLLALLVLFISIMVFVKIRCKPNAHRDLWMRALARNALHKMEIRKYTKSSGNSKPNRFTRLSRPNYLPVFGSLTSVAHTVAGQERCAICLEDYREGSDLRVLFCGHEFHPKCVDPWLLSHRRCPLCQYDVVYKEYPHTDDTKGSSDRDTPTVPLLRPSSPYPYLVEMQRNETTALPRSTQQGSPPSNDPFVPAILSIAPGRVSRRSGPTRTRSVPRRRPLRSRDTVLRTTVGPLGHVSGYSSDVSSYPDFEALSPRIIL
ncbi:unnamed protein product, partial [Mesorhabditis belari]|uniref:RING-type domain-containing protein n=1 Tax=Mesorhabditis belari TaxID=2138241 RepID=A0AAF3EAF3_9BILA